MLLLGGISVGLYIVVRKTTPGAMVELRNQVYLGSERFVDAALSRARSRKACPQSAANPNVGR
jgi:hypothetical protein